MLRSWAAAAPGLAGRETVGDGARGLVFIEDAERSLAEVVEFAAPDRPYERCNGGGAENGSESPESKIEGGHGFPSVYEMREEVFRDAGRREHRQERPGGDHDEWRSGIERRSPGLTARRREAGSGWEVEGELR